MKRLTAILLAAACLALGQTGASAQDKYPNRPIKVLVPYAPGGATDITARIVADEIQKITGQSFLVINKPGAFGMLAIDEMAKAAPDGYTLMIGNVSTNAITPIIYKNKLNFDYTKNVTAVTNLVDVPAFLLVTTANDFPVKSGARADRLRQKEPRQDASTAPSATAPIRTTTWPISPSAPAISTCPPCRTRTAPPASFRICCVATCKLRFSTSAAPPAW